MCCSPIRWWRTIPRGRSPRPLRGGSTAPAPPRAGARAIDGPTDASRHALVRGRVFRGRALIYTESRVTGWREAAAPGTLTLGGGAEPADLERARPYLAPLSATIRHFGAA